MKKGDLVAVYGSLRKGLHNHSVLGNSFLHGTDKLSGWRMRSLGCFPALFDAHDSYEAEVEVYEVDTDYTARRLDMLEGYPSFYDREYVATAYGMAWVYFIQDEQQYAHCAEVSSGDWLEYVSDVS